MVSVTDIPERRGIVFAKRRLIPFVALIVALPIIFAGPVCAQQKRFFAIATGGTYYPLGGILAQALSNKTPNIITAQSGNASVANCNLIKSHQIESGFVQNDVAYAAYNGVAQFEGNPVGNPGDAKSCPGTGKRPGGCGIAYHRLLL